MPFGAIVPVVAAIGGAVIAANGAKSAASTAAQGAQDAAAEQAREFNITQGNAAPYLNIGQQAINRLGSIYGYSPSGGAAPPSNAPAMSGGGFASTGGAPNAFGVTIPGSAASTSPATRNNIPGYDPSSGYQITPSGGVNALIPGGSTPPAGSAPSGTPATAPDYSSFYQSPDYNFVKQQGTQGIENSFSASGGAKSGNALKALADFNSNLAAGQFGNYFNQQASLAGIGQTATGQVGAAGTAAGAQIGNSLIQAGDARASGIAGQYNAIGSGISGIGQGLGYYLQNRGNGGNYGNGYVTSGAFGSNPSGNAAAIDPATGADYSAWSDPRLKEDVQRVGKTDAGLPIYKYRMKGNAMVQMGVMADEAKKKFPGAVKKDPSGYLKVNYLRVH